MVCTLETLKGGRNLNIGFLPSPSEWLSWLWFVMMKHNYATLFIVNRDWVVYRVLMLPLPDCSWKVLSKAVWFHTVSFVEYIRLWAVLTSILLLQKVQVVFFNSETVSSLVFLKGTAPLHKVLQWFRLAAVTKLWVPSFNWKRACYRLLLKFFRSEDCFPALWSRRGQASWFSPCV